MRRLLRLLTVSAAERRFRLAWSRWRRAHQATARCGHSARRARAQPAPLPRPPAPSAAPAPPDETPPATSAAAPAMLTDAQWIRVAPLLPAPLGGRGGRPPRDRRQVVAGLLWLARTGAAWRELPPAYGAWLSVYRYYHRWTASGHWPRILHALQEGDADL